MENRIPSTRQLTGAELYSIGPHRRTWAHPVEPQAKPGTVRGWLLAACVGVLIAIGMHAAIADAYDRAMDSYAKAYIGSMPK